MDQVYVVDPAIKPAVTARKRRLGVRVAQSILLWLGIGAVAGAGLPPENTFIGIVSGIIAGMIVMPIFGLLFGLIGAHWRETALGGLAGFVVGLVTATAGGFEPPGMIMSFGLINGALLGASFSLATTVARMVGERLLLRTIGKRVGGDEPVVEALPADSPMLPEAHNGAVSCKASCD